MLVFCVSLDTATCRAWAPEEIGVHWVKNSHSGFTFNEALSSPYCGHKTFKQRRGHWSFMGPWRTSSRRLVCDTSALNLLQRTWLLWELLQGNEAQKALVSFWVVFFSSLSPSISVLGPTLQLRSEPLLGSPFLPQKDCSLPLPVPSSSHMWKVHGATELPAVAHWLQDPSSKQPSQRSIQFFSQLWERPQNFLKAEELKVHVCGEHCNDFYKAVLEGDASCML